MLRHRERMEENGIAPLSWEGKRSAAAAPDAEVVDKPTRRRFSPSYKLRVVEEADRCTEPGEVGRLLRREGLYSSHLTTWRKAVRSGWLRALSKRRGRKPSERNPLEGKVRKLERENTRLEKELEKARLIIDVQGKVAGLQRIWQAEAVGDELMTRFPAGRKPGAWQPCPNHHTRPRNLGEGWGRTRRTSALSSARPTSCHKLGWCRQTWGWSPYR